MSNQKLTLRIGIASREAMKNRTIAIARGELRPAEDDPRIWFSSLESLAKILSERNMLLLEIIRSGRPRSFAELALLSGRAVSNLSRTLHSMQRIGLVELREEDHRKVPSVCYDNVALDVSLHQEGRAKAA